MICTNLVAENSKVRFAAAGGAADWAGGMGTLYLSNTNLLSETLDQFDGVRLIIPDFTAWSVANLAISNRVVALGPLDGAFTNLTVANDLTITNGGLSVGGVALTKAVNFPIVGPASNPEVTVGGNVRLTGGSGLALGLNGQGSVLMLNVGTNVLVDGTGSALTLGGTNQTPQSLLTIGNTLTLTNGGALSIYAGVTNAATTNYGALVTVTGAVSVALNSWIYPYSQWTNGGSVRFKVGSLALAGGVNGGINADIKGYGAGFGPGGTTIPGAGYGGKGGDTTSWGAGKNPYGSSNAPIDPGSGASGAGGGLVWVESDGAVSVDGLISANGATITYGGGSGGGIFIAGATFGGGASGTMRANGANSGYGGGGGGRIAVWIGVSEAARQNYLAGTPGRVIQSLVPPTNKFVGALSVTNGTGTWNPPDSRGAFPGTVLFFAMPQGMGTLFSFF